MNGSDVLSYFIIVSNDRGENVFRKYTDNYSEDYDLMLNDLGIEKCVPGKVIGPEKRDVCVLHKVIDGSGIFKIEGKKYNLKKGDLFYIPGGIEAYYKSDNDNPLFYIWVTFDGCKSKTIMDSTCFENNYVVTDKDDVIEKSLKELLEYIKSINHNIFSVIGKLYLILGSLNFGYNKYIGEEIQEVGYEYVEKALEYIKKNFNKDCSPRIIAEYIGITRGYLCKLFIKHLGITPTQYIEKFRIEQACELIFAGEKKLIDISYAVGYKDYAYFSNVFKKNFGINPSEFAEKRKKFVGN